jgi:hypothetical protein
MTGHLLQGEPEPALNDSMEVSGMSERVAIVAGAGGDLGRSVAGKLAAAGPEQVAHSVLPEAIADVIAHLVSDASAPVSGVVVPAYGA